MANKRIRFCAFPSVVPAGRKTTITIFPCDISRRFRGELEYEVGVIGLSDDMVHYYDKEPLDLPYVIGPRRPGDVDACFADPRKAKELLGWEATKNLEDMCRDAWNWQRNNPKGYHS